MVQINFALREVNCKIVYYGPGLSGKTTNLEVIHAKAPAEHRGELTSIATEGDRTLFFDFLPLNLGTVAGMKTKFQLYTVPGQVFYNSTRKLVLQGVDGIVFVADSRACKLEENIESLENLQENLQEYGLNLADIPHVIQYNKRDLPDILPVEELQKHLNPYNAPYVEAAAVTGQGVFPTLKKLAGMVLENLNRQQTGSVRRKTAAREREPALVAAGRAKGTESSPGSAEGRTAAPGSTVVRERVGSVVKPVERRAPIKRKTAPAAAGSSVARRKERAATQQGAAPQEQAGPRKNKRIVWILIGGLLLLGAAGAYLYFSGVLESFMK